MIILKFEAKLSTTGEIFKCKYCNFFALEQTRILEHQNSEHIDEYKGMSTFFLTIQIISNICFLLYLVITRFLPVVIRDEIEKVLIKILLKIYRINEYPENLLTLFFIKILEEFYRDF